MAITLHDASIQADEWILKVIMGTRTPPEAEVHQMLLHLGECPECATRVEVLYAALHHRHLEDEAIREVLEAVHNWIVASVLDQELPAFLETWELGGFVKAEDHFPRLAKHLHVCEMCRAEVEACYADFHHDIEQGLMPRPEHIPEPSPLARNKRFAGNNDYHMDAQGRHRQPRHRHGPKAAEQLPLDFQMPLSHAALVQTSSPEDWMSFDFIKDKEETID